MLTLCRGGRTVALCDASLRLVDGPTEFCREGGTPFHPLLFAPFSGGMLLLSQKIIAMGFAGQFMHKFVTVFMTHSDNSWFWSCHENQLLMYNSI